MPDAVETTRNEVNDLYTLVRRYVLQETVGPLKALGRTMAFASGAAVLLGVGGILLLVGLLRLLQGETGTLFAGVWSWVPYFITLIVGLAGLAFAGFLIYRSSWVQEQGE